MAQSEAAQLRIGASASEISDQANLKWSVGRLLVLCAVCGLAPAYLVELRYGQFLCWL